MSIDAVIFDCDGTLVDSVPLAVDVLVEYLAELGVVLTPGEAAARFGDGRFADYLTEFERVLGYRLPAHFVPEFRQRRARAVRTRLRAIDGAADLLGALRVPVAVASNGPLEQTRLSLEVTGLLRYFASHVFSAYELNSWKPAPDLFLHTAEALGVHPSRCAVIEDGASGVEAGIAAGMTVFVLCAEDRWRHERVHPVRNYADLRLHLLGKVKARSPLPDAQSEEREPHR
jgi:HAD superfamily hydrolase (TIGR01509 family)